VDNGKLSVLTSARREDGFPPKCKTSTGNKLDFRSPSPSQKSALLKVPTVYVARVGHIEPFQLKFAEGLDNYVVTLSAIFRSDRM